MKKKDNQNSVVAFGVHGWFHIIYMMLMFWFYVGMINDGSNNIAGKIAEHMLGSAKMAGTISTCNSIAGIIGVALFIVIGILNRKIPAEPSCQQVICAAVCWLQTGFLRKKESLWDIQLWDTTLQQQSMYR